jgi:hypothetical protein
VCGYRTRATPASVSSNIAGGSPGVAVMKNATLRPGSGSTWEGCSMPRALYQPTRSRAMPYTRAAERRAKRIGWPTWSRENHQKRK